MELVAVQSDTGTKLECDIAKKNYEMIKEYFYFVWAYRKGKTDKTIIFMGHYDAVGIETYGTLKPYALNPDLLKSKLKEINLGDEELKEDLENDVWTFSRGIADMKAGVAINMHILFTNYNKDVNILFVAVLDEENMSSSHPKEERQFLNNLTLPKKIYDIPVEQISELNIPSILLGPACEDSHKFGERVYMPDVMERIPRIIEKIIGNM